MMKSLTISATSARVSIHDALPRSGTINNRKIEAANDKNDSLRELSESKNISLAPPTQNDSSDLKNRTISFRPELSAEIPLTDLQREIEIMRCVDDIIYAAPVDKDEGKRAEFFKELIANKTITDDMLLKPLVNDDLTKALAKAGFQPKLEKKNSSVVKDSNGQEVVRPGSFYNKDTHSTIQLSTRTTKNGDTEWNLFFKGVKQTDTHTIGSAVKNIARGPTNSLIKLCKKAMSDKKNGLNQSENRQHDDNLPIYKSAQEATSAFVALADKSNGANDKKIVITVAGHSMGGGLAQTGFVECHEKIDKLIVFQAMDSTSSSTVDKMKNQELAEKTRDVHVSGDGLTGTLKTIRNSKTMNKFKETLPHIRKTVKSTEYLGDVHTKFHNYLQHDFEKNLKLV